MRDGETGEAIIAGTTLTVAEILRELSRGSGVTDVLDRHPELTREGVEDAISFAVAAVQREARYDSHGTSAGVVREARVSPPAGAVMLDREEYEGLLEEIEFLSALNRAQVAAAAGQTLSTDEVRARFRARYGG